MVEYEVALTADLGKALPSVGSLLDEINDVLATHGREDRKLHARGQLVTMSVNVGRSLTKDEKEKIAVCIERSFNENKSLGQYDWRVQSFRRKSRQSRSQSVSP